MTDAARRHCYGVSGARGARKRLAPLQNTLRLGPMNGNAHPASHHTNANVLRPVPRRLVPQRRPAACKAEHGHSGRAKPPGTAEADSISHTAAAAPANDSSSAKAADSMAGLHAVNRPLWRSMAWHCWRLVERNLWPLLVAHAVTDAVVFILHRLSHRATNEVAVAVLGGGMLTKAAIGNMWWLSVDPAIANFQTGYQPLTFLFFFIAFPLNVFVKAWASIATILLCQQAWKGGEWHQTLPTEDQAVEAEAAAGWWQPRQGLQLAFRTLREVQPQIAALWWPVFVVELLVALAVVPLQFASLAVVTLPVTLPIILDLQAAGPVAVAEGLHHMAAVQRSRRLLRNMRWQLALPYVGLVLVGRLLEASKATLLNSMPSRFYQELVELPLVVLVGGTVLSALLARLQDVLPFVAYKLGVQLEDKQ